MDNAKLTGKMAIVARELNKPQGIAASYFVKHLSDDEKDELDALLNTLQGWIDFAGPDDPEDS